MAYFVADKMTTNTLLWLLSPGSLHSHPQLPCIGADILLPVDKPQLVFTHTK